MVALIIALILLVVFFAVGLLVWGIVRLTGRRRKGRAILKWTGICWLVFLPVFFFGIAPIWTAGLISASGTRPFDLDQQEDPATYGCAFEDVAFSSRDGMPLRGWWMAGIGRPPILVGHGLFRNRLEVVERACDWNKLGFAVLAFDFRRHSLTSERPSEGSVTLGYKERLDVLGGIDFVQSKGHRRAILAGVSMGAVASIAAAAEEPDKVAAVIADSPFDSLEGTIRHHTRIFLGLPAFPFADVFLWRLERLGDFDGAQLDVEAALSRLPDTPVLFIYGSEDERMPRATAEALYSAAPSPVKDLLFVEGARHGAAYRRARERYNKAVVGFLRQVLASDAPPQPR